MLTSSERNKNAKRGRIIRQSEKDSPVGASEKELLVRKN